MDWREGLDEARAESSRTGVPIFWYVPTVSGSPMDRQREIDRYMMAGPFSHPDVVALLNAGFVPVREVADRVEQRVYGLRPGGFVEPGFLVLAPDGAETARAHRIVTLHPNWFVERLRSVAADVPAPRELPGPLSSAWKAYASGDLDVARKSLEELSSMVAPDTVKAEAGFLMGAITHRQGAPTMAASIWQGVAAEFPEQPWAWKAAAEAEGHGPFAFGFEDFLDIEANVLVGDLPTTRAPLGAYSETELRRRSLRFLTDMQLRSGQYIDSRYDFGGTDGLVNVYMAVTAIVGMALLEELAGEEFPGDRDRCEAALQRILGHTKNDLGINRDDRDEIVWAHLYRVLLLARWIELRPADADELRPTLERVTEDLLALQPTNGAWFHEYPNPFTTASCLIALRRADAAGAAVPRPRVELGLKALLQCRASNGGFSYGQTRRVPARASVPGSAGRMPLCELALLLWQQSDTAALTSAVRAGFEHHHELEDVRKYDDHAGRLRYGGFFFWYDMHGRTMALENLPVGDARRELAAAQREIILSIPEFDGCFVDSHELGRVYGTASALLCLARLRLLD